MDLSRCSSSRRSFRSDSRPYEKGSPSRKIPGGNSIPLRSARPCPSGESRSSVETASPYSTERRSSISLACLQNPQFSCVRRRTFIGLLRASTQPCTDVCDEIGYRDIHRVIGGTAIVGPPLDPTVGTHHDEGMTIAARPHHTIAVRRVGLRDDQARVGEDRDGETFVRRLLLQRVEWVGRDAHEGIDAERVKLVAVRLDVLELVPTGLAGEALLKVQQDGLAVQRGEIER